MKYDKRKLMIMPAIILIIFVLLASLTSVKNTSKELEDNANLAISDIKIREKNRAELIINLADFVKIYDNHESDIIKQIADTGKVDNDTSNKVVQEIITKSEMYPQLKSNELYKQLMTELYITEDVVDQSKIDYNNRVKEYTQYVRSTPHKEILMLLDYKFQVYPYVEYKGSTEPPSNIFDGKW